MMGMPKKGKMTGMPKFLIAGKFQKGLEKYKKYQKIPNGVIESSK